LKIGDFAPTGPVGRKFQVVGVTPPPPPPPPPPPTNNSSSQKTTLNDLLYDIKIWTDLSSILSQITRLTDRQTVRQADGQTVFSSLDHVCIACSTVKMKKNYRSALKTVQFSCGCRYNKNLFIVKQGKLLAAK